MTRKCQCGTAIPHSIKVDGVRKSLKNRINCLICVPFKSYIGKSKTSDQLKAANRLKFKNWRIRKIAETGMDPVSIRRNGRRAIVIKLLGGCCQFCGYKRCIRNLTFHHLDGKDGRLSSREFNRSVVWVLNEIMKCALACHNCHGEIHEGLFRIKVVEIKNKAIQRIIAKLPRNWDTIAKLINRRRQSALTEERTDDGGSVA